MFEGQRIHASVAFKRNTYVPQATFAHSSFSWSKLIGKGVADGGMIDDISGAQDSEDLLEMDLFDSTFVADAVRDFKDANPLEKSGKLRRLVFMALSCEVPFCHH